MKKTMKAAILMADWQPRKGIKPNLRDDSQNKRTQTGCNFLKNPRVVIVEKPIPKIGPYEVLVKVKACGICGSDVLMAWPDKNGYTNYPYIMRSGVIIGHEFSGIVVEVGDEVIKIQEKIGKKKFEPGTPIAAQCVINCGICENCKEGKFDQCLNNEEVGFSVDGAMAEYVKLDIRHIYSLSSLKKTYSEKNLYLAASLIEPLANAYNDIIERGGGIRAGENAVVIGGGPNGLAGVAILKVIGAAKIILFELSPERQLIGKKMGADYALNPIRDGFAEPITKIVDDYGVGIYFEAAGALPVLYPEIEKLMKLYQDSKLVLMGHASNKEKIRFDPEVYIGGYHKITGVHGHTKVWNKVINLVGSGKINPLPMVTKTIDLDQLPEYLEILRKDKRECKVIVTF